jgi:glutathione S-transferase
MIKLHHLETSRSTRLLWLLEELGLSYELVVYKRDPKTIRAPDSLKAVHPLGRSPLLEIDGKILAESGAIIMYLTRREGKLGAASDDSREDYNYWLHYAEGSAMTPLLVKLLTTGIRNASVPFFVKPIVRAIAAKVDKTFTDGELNAHFGWIEQALSDREYFAGGAFSAADIQMSYPIQASFVRGGMLLERPNTSAWLKRVESREAFKKAVEKGGEPMLRANPS